MSRDKREVFTELIDEVRRSQSATDRFDQAVAEAIGVNRTDMRCLDVLTREGRVTAGRLAGETGLTSGAMTTALDRLEGRGLVRRIRDATDRRRVLVEVLPGVLDGADDFFAEHIALGERLFQRYTTEQLELLLEFTREGRALNQRKAAELEQRTRRRRPARPQSAPAPPPGT
jgi:DNA-binding MarR family transcriptional regulator